MDVFWMFYVSSIYVLCRKLWKFTMTEFDTKHFQYSEAASKRCSINLVIIKLFKIYKQILATKFLFRDVAELQLANY